MDRQIKNIKLLEDGALKFKTGRIEIPKNRILKIENGVVHFLMNKDNYEGTVNVDDYFRLSLWAHRLVYDHKIIGAGVITYDNGYEHKSLAAAIMQTPKGKKVSYLDKNSFNCRKENLIVKENNFLNRT
jgi:hypothetical protein